MSIKQEQNWNYGSNLPSPLTIIPNMEKNLIVIVESNINICPVSIIRTEMSKKKEE